MSLSFFKAALLYTADCVPSFNATPGNDSHYFSVLEDAGFVTLSWDYDAGGETVRYVDLLVWNSWLNQLLQVARKPFNQPLQVFDASGYSGRVTFSERATFTISNITRNDDGKKFKCQVYFNSKTISRSIGLILAGKLSTFSNNRVSQNCIYRQLEIRHSWKSGLVSVVMFRLVVSLFSMSRIFYVLLLCIVPGDFTVFK